MGGNNKVHPGRETQRGSGTAKRMVTEPFADFQADNFEGYIRGNPLQKAWQSLKVLWFSSPLGLVFFLPPLRGYQKKYHKENLDAMENEMAPALLFLNSSILTLFSLPFIVQHGFNAGNLFGCLIFGTLPAYLVVRYRLYGAWARLLILFSILVPVAGVAILSSDGGCTGFRTWQRSFAFQMLCLHQEVGQFPALWLTYFIPLNFLVGVTKRVPFRVHYVVMFLQLTLNVWIAFLCVNARRQFSWRDVKLLFYHVCACPFIIWMHEREARYHFLAAQETESLVNQEKMLVSLLGHEIKSPLTFVNFFLERLKVDRNCLAGDRNASVLLPDALTSVSLLVDIVANCRRFAKFDSGAYERQMDVVNLRDLASSCLAMHGRERQAGMQLELHCPPDLIIVSDRRLWQHALLNLIGNAVKFTVHEKPQPVGVPCVKVQISRDNGDCVRVNVIDTGPGIAETDQKFIFGKYAQARTSFVASGLGSGLGLHFSLQIIRMLRGRLELVSPVCDGRGTNFSFTIPCVFAAEEHGASRATMASTVHATNDAAMADTQSSKRANVGCVPAKLRVLLVEDDDLNVLVMQTSLQVGMKSEFGTSVDVTRARTAEEALDLLGDANLYDLIVVDQHMEPAGGVMKGSQLVEILSAKPYVPGTQRPILCIASGNADDEAEANTFKAVGADIIWPKPYPGTVRIVSDIAQLFHLQDTQAY